MFEHEDIDYQQFVLLNKLSEENPLFFRGVNLFDVLRNDIGLKVARGYRARLAPERFALEGSLNRGFARKWKDVSFAIGGDVKKLLNVFSAGKLAKKTAKKKIYFHRSTKLARVADWFGASRNALSLSNKRKYTKRTIWAPVASLPDLISSQRTVGRITREIKAILRGGRAPVLDSDLVSLGNDVFKAVFNINLAHRILEAYRPDLVVVGGDNFLPPVALVLAARRLSIPTFCLQHGLDCERFFHEQIYSDYFCSWGEARAERCRVNSSFQPQRIFVTGCPEFDDIVLAKNSARSMENWLWLTRPHEPAKCCEPSRYPDEGQIILQALLEALVSFKPRRLVIKAHPRDDTRPYRSMVAKFGVDDRVQFVEGRGGVNPLIRDAGLVFSEDSTSGMEAMFFGKPVIHVHFAAAPPSLPFVEYGAALPGFSLDDIKASLEQLHGRDSGVESDLREGQKRFLKDFAGPLDGHALERVLEAISGLI
jgi:glycosyltransferase involved in cell wall biosynthesis